MSTLIVAAGAQMGGALGRALGLHHGPVGLIARRPGPLAALVDDLAASSIRAAAFPADITDDESLRGAIGAARAALGPPRVVVFNASLWVPGPPSTVSPDEFRTGLATGLTAALVTLQAVVEDLRAAAPDATLLFTGSGSALTADPTEVGLGIQKAGLRHLALAAAAELQPLGIHVATVTIRGSLGLGTAFDPEAIAAVYARLAQSGTDRPTEVMITRSGPDWH